jgi:Xaa-Pro aminopeptidase
LAVVWQLAVVSIAWGEPPATPLPARECVARRARLAAEWAREIREGTLEPGLLVLSAANDSERSRFRQADNFIYLTGLSIPAISALMTPADADGRHREILFLPPKSRSRELWNGPTLSFSPEAAETTGFEQVAPPARFEELAGELLGKGDLIYYLDEPFEEDGLAIQRVRRLIEGIKGFEGSERLELLPLEKLVHDQRRLKSEVESEAITRAIAATARGLAAGAALIRPGTTEYELQGAIEGGFIAAGAFGPGFPSIIGSGPNSCILHYNQNARRLEAGELVVIDVGASVDHYTADITRTLPVSGRFSPRQRAVYAIVLEAQETAARAARPGMSLAEVHQVAAKVIARGLSELGLLDGDPGEILSTGAYRRYFPHGTSHWLGIAVHDVGRGPLEPGAVFTIEPGIYISEESLGVRIEDDFIMTGEGRALRLSEGVPRTADDLERWIRSLRQGEARETGESETGGR